MSCCNDAQPYPNYACEQSKMPKRNASRGKKQSQPRRKAIEHEDLQSYTNYGTDEEKPIASSEDEELDEDLAFTVEDEKMYGHLLPPSSRVHHSDDGSSDEEHESSADTGGSSGDSDADSDDDEGVTAMDFLDANLARQDKETKNTGSSRRAQGQEREFAKEDGDQSQSHDQLLSFVQGLSEGTSKSAESIAARPSRRRPGAQFLPARYETVEESEYNVDQAGGSGDAPEGNTQLSISQLMQSLGDSGSFGQVKSALETLERSSGPMLAPAGSSTQARAARTVVYDQRTQSLTNRWQSVVAANRRAETINFVSEAEPKQEREKMTTHSMASKFKPSNALEQDIHSFLTASNMQAEGAMKDDEATELRANNLSEAEVNARQDKLAKLQALMFYDEQKRRRANKIKSKTYRRIKKRQRVRQQKEEEKKLREHDPEAYAAMQELQATQRAKERATLRHRERNKWVQNVLRMGGAHRQESREAIMDRLRRADELRQRMEKVGGPEQDGDSSDDEDSEEEAQAEAAAARDPGATLRRARQSILADVGLDQDGRALSDNSDADETPVDAPERAPGLFKLKFMQDAARRKREEAREEARALAKELDREIAGFEKGEESWEVPGNQAEDETEEYDDGEGAKGGMGSVGGARGARHSFMASSSRGAGASSERVQEDFAVEKSDDDDDDDDDHDDDDGERAATTTRGRRRRGTARPPVDAPEDDAATTRAAKDAVATRMPDGQQQLREVGSSRGTGARVKGFIRVDDGKGTSAQAAGGKSFQEVGFSSVAPSPRPRDSATTANGSFEVAGDNPWLAAPTTVAGSSAAATSRRTGARTKRYKGAAGEGDREGDVLRMDAVLTGPTPSARGKRARPEDSIGSKASVAPGKPRAQPAHLSQAELVRRAFAGVGATEESLREEKEEEEQSKKPKAPAVSASSGWGAWAGEGVVPSRRAREAKKREEQNERVSLKGRKDAKMRFAKVSEKKDKKLARHQTAKVPYPFTSREQYERSLRHPLGSEWNTPSAVGSMNKPESIVRAGTVVEPIQLSKVRRTQGNDNGPEEPPAKRKKTAPAKSKSNRKR